VPGGRPKATVRQGVTGGVQQPGRAITTKMNSLACRDCEDSAELRSCRLGKRFMEPSDRDTIPLCKILYFVRGMGLLAEWKDGDAQ